MKKVIVGMSGGVDSAVTAYLLKAAGFSVTGITLRTWFSAEGEESRCCESALPQRRAFHHRRAQTSCAPRPCDGRFLLVPVKKETKPYEGTGLLGNVHVGDEITYELSYRNYKTTEADVVIKDKLDKNVEFVSASGKGKYVAADHEVALVEAMADLLAAASRSAVFWCLAVAAVLANWIYVIRHGN